jgi:hypothetical protein
MADLGEGLGDSIGGLGSCAISALSLLAVVLLLVVVVVA